MKTSISLSIVALLLACIAASPALALDGLAPAAPCAEEESPVTGPVTLLFSPQNVASAAGPPSMGINPPALERFEGLDACETSGGCGGLDAAPRMNPPVNDPGGGEAP